MLLTLDVRNTQAGTVICAMYGCNFVSGCDINMLQMSPYYTTVCEYTKCIWMFFWQKITLWKACAWIFFHPIHTHRVKPERHSLKVSNARTWITLILLMPNVFAGIWSGHYKKCIKSWKTQNMGIWNQNFTLCVCVGFCTAGPFSIHAVHTL